MSDTPNAQKQAVPITAPFTPEDREALLRLHTLTLGYVEPLSNKEIAGLRELLGVYTTYKAVSSFTGFIRRFLYGFTGLVIVSYTFKDQLGNLFRWIMGN